MMDDELCGYDRAMKALDCLCRAAGDFKPRAAVVLGSGVNARLPREVPLTSFSILMARYKGDLHTFVNGARRIDSLEERDRVLIAEACTHHALEGDIGREKLPRWLREKVGKKLTVDVASGLSFPDNLSRYSLILHCGACMLTKKQLMSRLI